MGEEREREREKEREKERGEGEGEGDRKEREINLINCHLRGVEPRCLFDLPLVVHNPPSDVPCYGRRFKMGQQYR